MSADGDAVAERAIGHGRPFDSGGEGDGGGKLAGMRASMRLCLTVVCGVRSSSVGIRVRRHCPRPAP